jgi:hypothetical protein
VEMGSNPPPKTAELVGPGAGGGSITSIDSDTVPRYAGYSAHKWVKVGSLADSIAFRSARDTAIAQYDDRFYWTERAMSNVFVSTILGRSGVTITKNQFRALGWAPALCRCFQIFFELESGPIQACPFTGSDR